MLSAFAAEIAAYLFCPPRLRTQILGNLKFSPSLSVLMLVVMPNGAATAARPQAGQLNVLVVPLKP
jgi:hypothetical protein